MESMHEPPDSLQRIPADAHHVAADDFPDLVVLVAALDEADGAPGDGRVPLSKAYARKRFGNAWRLIESEVIINGRARGRRLGIKILRKGKRVSRT